MKPRKGSHVPARLAGVMLLSCAFPPGACAGLIDADPASYRERLRTLAPGDTLRLAPGEYAGGLPVHGLSGGPGNPIVIRGPARGAPAIFVARPGHNTVSIIDSRYVEIRDLVLEGRGVPVDAVKCEGHARWAHHITLENLLVLGHGNNQQTVGISTKCPAWDWTIRGNTILGAGTGMYLGDSDGSAPFVAGRIEYNVIIDSLGYNLQVKHQKPRPLLPGMPEGPSVTVIRHNVFAKPRAGSAESARPNVLVGHFPLEGPGREDRYAIYGNFFYENLHEALFQGEGNVALYSNLFVNRHGDGIHIQPHNDVPRRIEIAFNTVLAAGTGIRVLRKAEAAPSPRQAVRANAVFAASPIDAQDAAGNFTAAMAESARYLNRPNADPGGLDLYPKRELPVREDRDGPRLGEAPEGDLDFDGLPRPPASVGAYAPGRGHPRWLPRLERKPR
ncbi:MAG: hypothetical protein OHK0026_02820 [Rhodocyclaceae bacterium]